MRKECYDKYSYSLYREIFSELRDTSMARELVFQIFSEADQMEIEEDKMEEYLQRSAHHKIEEIQHLRSDLDGIWDKLEEQKYQDNTPRKRDWHSSEIQHSVYEPLPRKEDLFSEENKPAVETPVVFTGKTSDQRILALEKALEEESVSHYEEEWQEAREQMIRKEKQPEDSSLTSEITEAGEWEALEISEEETETDAEAETMNQELDDLLKQEILSVAEQMMGKPEENGHEAHSVFTDQDYPVESESEYSAANSLAEDLRNGAEALLSEEENRENQAAQISGEQEPREGSLSEDNNNSGTSSGTMKDAYELLNEILRRMDEMPGMQKKEQDPEAASEITEAASPEAAAEAEKSEVSGEFSKAEEAITAEAVEAFSEAEEVRTVEAGEIFSEAQEAAADQETGTSFETAAGAEVISGLEAAPGFSEKSFVMPVSEEDPEMQTRKTETENRNNLSETESFAAFLEANGLEDHKEAEPEMKPAFSQELKSSPEQEPVAASAQEKEAPGVPDEFVLEDENEEQNEPEAEKKQSEPELKSFAEEEKTGKQPFDSSLLEEMRGGGFSDFLGQEEEKSGEKEPQEEINILGGGITASPERERQNASLRNAGILSEEHPIAESERKTQQDNLPSEPVDQETKPEKEGGISRALFTICLFIVLAVLVWLIINILMYAGVLPKMDFGYSWFNEHVFPMFWI